MGRPSKTATVTQGRPCGPAGPAGGGPPHDMSPMWHTTVGRRGADGVTPRPHLRPAVQSDPAYREDIPTRVECS